MLTMAAAQPVSQAIAYLQATRHDYLLALDQGQVVGLLTADAALHWGLAASFGSRAAPSPPRRRVTALRVLAGPLLC